MLQFLVPKFIKNLDKTLLLNFPFWYIVKIHYILYFTAIMWILSYGIGCVLPINITEYNPTDVTNIWIFVFSVLAFILFCVWVYYLIIYNNEDHFGKYTLWDDLKFLGIFMIGINLLLSFSYPMQMVVKTRLANTITDTELAKQYNDLNMANKYTTSDVEDFQYCGYEIHDSVDTEKLRQDTLVNRENRYSHDLNKYKRFVRFSNDNYSYLNYKLSSLLLNQTSGIASSEYMNALYSASQIEAEYKTHQSDEAKLNVIKKLFAIQKIYQTKYAYPIKYSPQDYLDNYKHYEKTCMTYFPEAFNLNSDDKTNSVLQLPINDCSYQMANIYKAKFTFSPLITNGYILFTFYFSFFTSLLIILFRNNKWQHYLVSVVTFILLGIIIGILSVAFNTISFSSFFPSFSFLIWLIVAAISLWYYFKKEKYQVIGVVATNLIYITLPIIPFLFCVYLHEVFDVLKCQYNYEYNHFDYYQAECQLINNKYENMLMYAQIIGISSFVIIAMPLYKLFYAKQKALPKDK